MSPTQSRTRWIWADSARSLKDYHDLMDAGDLKHPVQVNEYEFNPFLQHDPNFQALRAFEREHGIVPMSESRRGRLRQVII